MMALIFRLRNVDVKRYLEFRGSKPEEYGELMCELAGLGGFTLSLRGIPEDVIWVNNFIPDRFGLNVEDLTWTEVNARKKMIITYDYIKKHVPYRSLVVRELDNMLPAGRCISGDPVAVDLLAPIQSCICTGQAAGTAAGLAIKEDVNVKKIDTKVLQKLLTRQGVVLPSF